ncbi:MAG TPA: ABC transporter substrate-binding protein [Chloroflexota bacterium]|nr:ABC transporter substrate-binding protein [Chloroflexota bacterium]
MLLPSAVRSIGAGLLVLLVTACTGSGQPAPAAPSGSAPARPAATTAAAPSPQPTASGAPARVETVKVAETAAIAYAPVYVAEARGYYREQGIELDYQNVAGGADAVPLLARGDVDLNLAAISAGTFNAFERGLDIKIVAPMGILPLHDSSLPLLARKELIDNGTLKSVADLRGRKVAVNTKGAIVEYLLTKVLEQNGLALRDVEETPLPFPDHANALATGAIDASITAEPFATRALDLGSATKWIAEIAPGKMTTVVMYGGEFIRQRPDVARRWMLATMRGAREIQGPELGVLYAEKFYTPENLAVFEKKLGVSAQVIRDQVPYTWDPDLVVQTDFILDQERVHIQNGVLQLAQPIPAERLVDSSFVDAAREQLGKVR